jgi:ABC-2 type transport system permease protein
MKPFTSLSWVELKLFVRDPLATMFALIFPFIMLMLLAAVFGDSPPDDEVDGMLVFRGASGDDYYIAASVGIVAAAIGLLIIPVTLTGYRDRGILRRFRASGVSTRTLFGAHLTVGLTVAFVGSLLMILASTAIYGTMLPEDPIGVVAAFVLATLCLTSIGFLLSGLIPTARAAQGIGLILFFAAWMTSGTGPPQAVLPQAVRDIATFQPLTHVVIAIQDPWFGYGWNIEKLVILAAITIVAMMAALWRFDWA